MKLLRWTIKTALIKTVDLLYLMYLKSNDKELLELLIELEKLRIEITNHLNDYATSRSIKSATHSDRDKQPVNRSRSQGTMATETEVIHQR
jgi:hypothetical protein